MEVLNQYLKYDFTYEGKRHRCRVKLDESVPSVYLLYFNNDLETTWFKRIRHKGKFIEINIVIKEDWNDLNTLGQVVASAWVCVYDNKTQSYVVESFEPDYWEYIDEENPLNTVNKNTFYRIKNEI